MTCVTTKRVIDRSAAHRKAKVHPCAFNQSDNWIFVSRHMYYERPVRYHAVQCSSAATSWTPLRMTSFSLGHCPDYLAPSPSPIRATCKKNFWRQNSSFERQLRTKNTRYILYNMLFINTLKNSLKSKLLAFWKK